MKELIFKLINKYIQDYDLYETDESYWLINPETKEWVIELEKDGTLLYYYYFFEKIYRLFSLDVVENQHYITEWVENTLQNGVRDTKKLLVNPVIEVENTLQNGVRHTVKIVLNSFFDVENTIQNGVKHTLKNRVWEHKTVEDTLQNGKKLN